MRHNSSVSVSFIAGSTIVRYAVRSKGCSGIALMHSLAGHSLFQHLFIQSRNRFRFFWLPVDKDQVASPVHLSSPFVPQPSVDILQLEPLALAANLGNQVLLVLWRVGGIEPLSEAAYIDNGVRWAQR